MLTHWQLCVLCVCFRSSLRVCARGGTGYTFGAFSILVRLPMGEPGEFRAARSVPVDTSHLPPGTVDSQGATGLFSPVALVCQSGSLPGWRTRGSAGGRPGGRGGAGPASSGSSGTALGAGLAGARLWEAGAAVEAPAAWGLALGGSACCCGQRAARVRCWGESSPRATSCWQLRAVRCAQSAAADVKAVVVRVTAGSPRARWGSPSQVCRVRAARLA